MHPEGSVPPCGWAGWLTSRGRNWAVCLGARRPSWCHRGMGGYWAQSSSSQSKVCTLHTRLGAERPRQGQHYLSESQRGQGLQDDTKAQVSRDHNQQARETQMITAEVGRRAALGMRPAWASLIKLPFPDVLKGEGEELEASPSVEFILEFHPGTKKSRAVIS